MYCVRRLLWPNYGMHMIKNLIKFHASQTKNMKILKPNISNHNIPLIYFSDKRENVLVYLSNAIEKFCKEKHFKFEGFWHKWGPYGFDKDGRLCL